MNINDGSNIWPLQRTVFPVCKVYMLIHPIMQNKEEKGKEKKRKRKTENQNPITNPLNWCSEWRWPRTRGWDPIRWRRTASRRSRCRSWSPGCSTPTWPTPDSTARAWTFWWWCPASSGFWASGGRRCPGGRASAGRGSGRSRRGPARRRSRPPSWSTSPWCLLEGGGVGVEKVPV